MGDQKLSSEIEDVTLSPKTFGRVLGVTVANRPFPVSAQNLFVDVLRSMGLGYAVINNNIA